MARPYYDRESGRDEGDWRERDERRFRYGGQERGRYEASGDWDRDRYREAPEYGRDQNYGWSRDRNQGYDDEHRSREFWRSRENPQSRPSDSWNAGDAWRSGGSRSDYDRFSQGGQGRQYGQSGQGYGARSFGYDYGQNEYRSSGGRFQEASDRDTLRGIGGSNDEQRWGGSAFQGFGHNNYSNESTRRGGFAGKGPRGYTRSDDRIREDVCDRLSADDEVDASDITVTVSKGEVTLEGTVPDRHSKRRAEDISESVNGVSEVHNRLRANKNLIQEVGDKLMGRSSNETGHAGSGTRNSPAGSTTGIQNNH